MSSSYQPYSVIWDGSRQRDPYLCVDPDERPRHRLISNLTADERLEVMALATRTNATVAGQTYGLNAISVGWLPRQARKAGQ